MSRSRSRQQGSDGPGARLLDREFKTVRYELKFEKRDANTIHYWADTVLRIQDWTSPSATPTRIR